MLVAQDYDDIVREEWDRMVGINSKKFDMAKAACEVDTKSLRKALRRHGIIVNEVMAAPAKTSATANETAKAKPNKPYAKPFELAKEYSPCKHCGRTNHRHADCYQNPVKGTGKGNVKGKGKGKKGKGKGRGKGGRWVYNPKDRASRNPAKPPNSSIPDQIPATTNTSDAAPATTTAASSPPPATVATAS